MLRAQGMHPRVLSSPEILAPLPGICCRADAPASLHEIARVLQLHVVPGAVISHATAAELYGIPVPVALTRDRQQPLHCTVPSGEGRHRTARLIVHESAQLTAVEHRGLRMTDPVTTLQQIAFDMRPDDLVVCADALLSGGKNTGVMLSHSDMQKKVALSAGPGAAALRHAVLRAREGVWSPMETRARLLLIDVGLPEPVPNLKVLDPSTGRHYYVDLAYPAERIAIEYDSDFHRMDRTQWQKDLSKDAALRRMGWRVLRISIADIRRPQGFLRALQAERAAGGADAGAVGTSPAAAPPQ